MEFLGKCHFFCSFLQSNSLYYISVIFEASCNKMMAGSGEQEMLEIQQRWAAQLDTDLQQHGEWLCLHSPAGHLPLGGVRLDHQSPGAGHHALLGLHIQVTHHTLSRGEPITVQE